MAKWMRGSYVLLLLLTFLMISGSFQILAKDQDHINGDGTTLKWHIDVVGTRGTFKVDDKTWQIEYFQTTPGLNNYSRTLSFLGREEDDFIRVDIFMDFIGSNFLVYLYDYKKDSDPKSIQNDTFVGSYKVDSLDQIPTFMANYIPKGKVPNYHGQDFVLKSQYADVTSSSGTINYQDLSLKVFPVYNVVISDNWSEFWTIGIEPTTGRTYFLIFYRTQDAWLVDLWSGEVQILPLGKALITADDVVVQRDFNLEDLAK